MQAQARSSGGKDRIPPPSQRQRRDCEYWRRRAEEALEIAYEMTDAVAISQMLEIGRRYELRARQAERQA